MKVLDNITAAFLAGALIVGLLVGISALEGFVLKILWNFALADSLHLLPRISFKVAWAITLILNLFVKGVRYEKKSS